jgi:hypothetical protein
MDLHEILNAKIKQMATGEHLISALKKPSFSRSVPAEG